MPNSISNTSPLVYLHRIDALQWLPQLFDEVWTPQIAPLVVEQLRVSGMWISDEVRLRILRLAD